MLQDALSGTLLEAPADVWPGSLQAVGILPSSAELFRARSLGSLRGWAAINQPFRAQGPGNEVCKDLLLMRPSVLFQQCRANCTKGEAPTQQGLIQPQALHSTERLEMRHVIADP